MKKTKSKPVFTTVWLLPFSAGIFLGVFALLFAGVIGKSGFPQLSQAANPNKKNIIPFVCQSCFLDQDLTNRLSGKDLTDSYLRNLTFSDNVDISNTVFVNAIF